MPLEKPLLPATVVPSADMGTYVPALDPARQVETAGENSPRHRVRNNLPGTSDFCPLVFRTPVIEQFMALILEERAREVVTACRAISLRARRRSYCSKIQSRAM